MSGDRPILRPFVWLFIEKLGFIIHDPAGGHDYKFRYLTSFELDEGGSDWTSKFSIVDTDYSISDSFIWGQFVNTVCGNTTKRGSPDPEEIKEVLVAKFQFGYHEDESCSPWRHPEGIVSPIYTGYITEISLNRGDGFVQYDFSCLPLSDMLNRVQVADDQGVAPLTKIDPVKQRNIRQAIARVTEPHGIKIKYIPPEVEAELARMRITSEISINNKTIMKIVEEILAFMPDDSKKHGVIYRVRYPADEKKDEADKYQLVIEKFEHKFNEGGPIRTYEIAISKEDNACVIDFQPTIPSNLILGLFTEAATCNPGKPWESTDYRQERNPDIPLCRSARAAGLTDRESVNTPRMVCKDLTHRLVQFRRINQGWDANLTIIGDPGLTAGADTSTPNLGNTIELIVHRIPEKQGGKGGLVWKPASIEPLYTGLYIIEKITHKMGTGDTYTTTLAIKKVDPATEDPEEGAIGINE